MLFIWSYFAIVVVIVAGFTYRGMRSTYRQWRELRAHQEYVLQYGSALSRLPFIIEACVDTGMKRLEGIDSFYADAPLTVVVQYRGQPAGIVGFRFAEDSFDVIQLQGFARAPFNDVDAGVVLLDYAEAIARVCDRTIIRIVPAELQDFYEIQDPDPRIVERHQRRMRKRYDRLPSDQGYTPSTDGLWWEKVMEG